MSEYDFGNMYSPYIVNNLSRSAFIFLKVYRIDCLVEAVRFVSILVRYLVIQSYQYKSKSLFKQHERPTEPPCPL